MSCYAFSKDVDVDALVEKIGVLISEGKLNKSQSRYVMSKIISANGFKISEEDLKEFFTKKKYKSYVDVLNKSFESFKDSENLDVIKIKKIWLKEYLEGNVNLDDTPKDIYEKVIKDKVDTSLSSKEVKIYIRDIADAIGTNKKEAFDKYKDKNDTTINERIEKIRKISDIETRLKSGGVVTEQEKRYYSDYKKEKLEKSKMSKVEKKKRDDKKEENSSEKEEETFDQIIERELKEGKEKKIIRRKQSEKKEEEEYEEIKEDLDEFIKDQIDAFYKQQEQVNDFSEVSEKELEKIEDIKDDDEDGEELVQVRTTDGIKYILKSRLEEKADKEKDKEELKIRLRDTIDITDSVNMRKPSDIRYSKMLNDKGYKYAEWIRNNPNSSVDMHKSILEKLGLSPSMLREFFTLGEEEQEQFASIIIEKYEQSSDDDRKMLSWSFYEEYKKFMDTLRKSRGKLSYREKIKSIFQDIEDERKAEDEISSIFGEDDLNDLIEVDEKDEDEIDLEDEQEDDMSKNLEKNMRDNVKELVREFIEENVVDKENTTTELELVIKEFYKWLYKSYPSAPKLLVLTVKEEMISAFGKEYLRKIKGKITVINKKISSKLSENEVNKIRNARSFITLANSFDKKSNVYISFHMSAYKTEDERELDELISKYGAVLSEMTGKSFPDNFIQEYKLLWKKNLGRSMQEKMMNITPFVQRFLKETTKLYKNPLIQDPTRRRNRLRNLNSVAGLESRYLARLPSSLSETTKKCLMWHQVKPWWKLNQNFQSIVIAHHKGISKDIMPRQYKKYFGEFMYKTYLDNLTLNFYKPTKFYNLLLCHLNYNEKDLVQCNPNNGNSITLKTPEEQITIFTGIYTVNPNGSSDVKIVDKDMYKKECEWWKNNTYSPSVIMNNLRKMRVQDDTNEMTNMLRYFRNICMIYLNRFYETNGISITERQRDNIVDIIMKRLTKYNVSLSEFMNEFFTLLAPLNPSFFPSKSLRFYKNLWINPSRLDATTISNIIDLPKEYKYIEIYVQPEFEKRQGMISIYEEEIYNLTEENLVSFHNMYYTDRKKIKTIDGKKIGHFDEITLRRQIEKSKYYTENNNIYYCDNYVDAKDENKIILVKGYTVDSSTGDKVENVYCMNILDIYNLYVPGKKDEYKIKKSYTRKNKNDINIMEILIPAEVVELIYNQIQNQLKPLKNKFKNFSINNVNIILEELQSIHDILTKLKQSAVSYIETKDSKYETEYNKLRGKLVFSKGITVYDIDYENVLYEITKLIDDNERDTKSIEDFINSYAVSKDFKNVDVNLKCGYCEKAIHSYENVYKTYEKTENEIGDKQFNDLVLYCSSDCFNKTFEVLPEESNEVIKEESSYSFFSFDKIRNKTHTNLMLKMISENKIDLSNTPYKTPMQLKNDIENGKIGLESLGNIVGKNIMNKYNHILQYIQ